MSESTIDADAGVIPPDSASAADSASVTPVKSMIDTPESGQ